jgi:hypothetical protein
MLNNRDGVKPAITSSDRLRSREEIILASAPLGLQTAGPAE